MRHRIIIALIVGMAGAASVAEEASRWGEGSAPQVTPGPPADVQPPAHGPKYKGRTKLKIGEKRLWDHCLASPVSCMCPPESIKFTFMESEGWMALSQRKIVCAPASCPQGQALVKRTNITTGVVSFVCEVPRQ